MQVLAAGLLFLSPVVRGSQTSPRAHIDAADRVTNLPRAMENTGEGRFLKGEDFPSASLNFSQLLDLPHSRQWPGYDFVPAQLNLSQAGQGQEYDALDFKALRDAFNKMIHKEGHSGSENPNKTVFDFSSSQFLDYSFLNCSNPLNCISMINPLVNRSEYAPHTPSISHSKNSSISFFEEDFFIDLINLGKDPLKGPALDQLFNNKDHLEVNSKNRAVFINLLPDLIRISTKLKAFCNQLKASDQSGDSRNSVLCSTTSNPSIESLEKNIDDILLFLNQLNTTQVSQRDPDLDQSAVGVNQSTDEVSKEEASDESTGFSAGLEVGIGVALVVIVGIAAGLAKLKNRCAVRQPSEVAVSQPDEVAIELERSPIHRDV